MDKKEKVSEVYFSKLASLELFKNYAVLFVFYIFWMVVCLILYQFLLLFFSEKLSHTILSMMVAVPAGIYFVLPLVILAGIAIFAFRNKSEVITISELIICAFDYGIDCVNEAQIRNKSFYQLKGEFQYFDHSFRLGKKLFWMTIFQPVMLKRIKRNFLLSTVLGIVLIIAIYKV